MGRAHSWRWLCPALAAICAWVAVLPGVAAGSIAGETALGRRFEFEARSRLPLLNDLELTGFIDGIGQRIVAGLGDQPFAYRFFVVRDARLNAFAVPGGAIYVNSGLILQASSEDEIAGVLGHEIAHVHAHHLARQQDATQLLNYATYAATLLSLVQPVVGAGVAALSSATQLQYRREFEQEADYLGARYVRQAGFNPRSLLDFLQKMEGQQRGSAHEVPPYLLSHPLTQQRLTNLESVLGSGEDQAVRRVASFDLERAQLLARMRTEPAQGVLVDYQRRVQASPDDAQVQYLLGLVCFEAGLFDAARTSFDLARQSGIPMALRDLGRTQYRLRNLDEALLLLRAAVETRPADAVAWYELGCVLEEKGSDREARRAYEEAVRLAASYAEAHDKLGTLAGRVGDLSAGHYHLAEAAWLRGDYERAKGQLERASAAVPSDATHDAVRRQIEDLTERIRMSR